MKKVTIKTFNIDEEVYKQFSAHCKKNGISMSRKVENFIKDEISKLNIKSTSKKVVDKIEPLKQVHHTFSKYC